MNIVCKYSKRKEHDKVVLFIAIFTKDNDVRCVSRCNPSTSLGEMPGVWPASSSPPPVT